MSIPSILCLLLLIAGLFRPPQFLMITAFVLTAFGTTAILPPQFVGGITLLVGPAAFMFLVAKVLLTPGGFNGVTPAIIKFNYLGLLTWFTIIAVVGAFTLPKLFLGQTYLFPMRPTGRFLIAEPLQPVSANLTQSAYVIISFLVAAVFVYMVRSKTFVRDYSWAVLALGIATVTTGLMDMITSMAGINSILDIFRTASYAIMTEGEIAGVKRTVGLMPEASSFGALAVTSFALLLFTRHVFPLDIRNKLVFPLAFGCAAFAALSTSSTAYVALVIVLAVYGFDISKKLGTGTKEERIQTSREIVALSLFSIIGIFVMMYFESTRETVFELVDTMVLNKTKSQSFAERSSWNEQAIAAWLDTYGLGVGLGSARTSNFFVNILASAGFMGAIFFALFLIKLFFTKCNVDDPRLKELVHGAKLTLLPVFAMMALVGTTPDYGVVTAALFGVIIGASFKLVRRKVAKPDPGFSRA